MATTLKMNEVRFTNVIENPYTEEELFNKLLMIIS